MKKKVFDFHISNWVKMAILLNVYDMAAVACSYFLALWIRFDCQFSMIQKELLDTYLKFIPIYSVICLVVFILMKQFELLESNTLPSSWACTISKECLKSHITQQSILMKSGKKQESEKFESSEL